MSGPSVAPATSDDARRAEIATNLARLRGRIADACAAVGRDPGEITLIGVTKTYPADDVLRLAALGVTDIGENRDQEAAPKAVAVAEAGVPVRWHFIGQLQRNKCRSVARYADLVHSVDGVRLARTLDTARAGCGDTPLDVLVQVSIDGDPARGGALIDSGFDGGPTDSGAGGARTDGLGESDRSLSAVLDALAGARLLRLRGLMAVAPLGWEADRAFARLAEVAAAVRANHPAADILSAGMSGDLEQAIAYGATHIRVGSALLGMRAPLR
ncbi:MAG TPA: YggS family pyridoxal phosphate enzyme [Micromonosporaceae bacterium]